MAELETASGRAGPLEQRLNRWPEEFLKLYIAFKAETNFDFVDVVPQMSGLTQLLEETVKLVDAGSRTAGWPTNPAVASSQLSEYELPLRAHGVTMQRQRAAGGNRDRTLFLQMDHARDTGRTGTGETGAQDR